MATALPGDTIVQNFTLQSPRFGTVDLRVNFLSCSIVEEIFTPGIVAEIEVLDVIDVVGRIQFAGDERVTLTLVKAWGSATQPTRSSNLGPSNPVPGAVSHDTTQQLDWQAFQQVKTNSTSVDRVSMTYNFLLNSIKEVKDVGALHAKVYKMMCVSIETLYGQGIYVQDSYNQPIDQIVSTLFGMIGSSYGLTTESTQGSRHFNIQNQPIYTAIEMLRRDAVSTANPSSNYMFWQTSLGFYFTTMEWMTQRSDVKSFVRDDLVGRSIFTDIDNNILAWHVDQMMDAISRVKAGVVNQQVSTFNVFTNEFRQNVFSQVAAADEMGAFVPTTMPSFWSLFNQCYRSVIRYINPNDNLGIGPSYMPDAIPNKMVNMAQMMEQQLLMTVIGDPVLNAGSTVTCNVPQLTTQSPPPAGQDIQLSGRWLISKSEFSVRRPDEKPRWINRLECIKGAYNR